MQTSNRFIDDLARLASGTLGSLTGLKSELDALLRQRFLALTAEMELVRREEFEAVKAMASNARLANEALTGRLAALEAELAAAKAKLAALSHSATHKG